MKAKNRTLKTILSILVIILISLISFMGIFVKDKNRMKNILPDYELGMDFKGGRVFNIKPDETVNTKYYDSEGKEVESSSIDESKKDEYTKEETPVNSKDSLNDENYEKVKKIVEERLNLLSVKEYEIRKSSSNGEIYVTIPEDSNTDTIVSEMTPRGEFKIIDSEDKRVLLTNNDIKDVKVGYGNTTSGTSVFINIQFNKEGTEKFKNITNTYVQTTKTVEQEGEEAKEETVTKEISIKIDDTALLSTHFSEQVTNGLLQLSVGSSANSTTDKLKEYLQEATSMAALLDSGKMPVVYQVEQNKYILSEVTQDVIAKVIVASIIVLTLAIIYLIIKYKGKGILAGISIIGYVALLLLAIRYANVEVSIAGVIEILFSTLINYMLVVSMLKEEKINNAIKKYSLILIPTLVIAIAFTFANIAVGTVLFWGIAIAMLYNISITNLLLRD